MVGCSVRTNHIILVLLALSALIIASHAQSQSASHYQSVGGDFGKTWLSDFNAQNPKPVDNNSKSNNLWSWGSAPKGRSVINGQLMTDPYYYWKSLNLSSGWLGQAYVDNKTGYPVFAFIDPYTGYPDYFYMDPKTGAPVYVNPGSGSTGSAPGAYVPPVLMGSPGNPWLGIPDISDTSDVYGNGGSGTSVYGSGYYGGGPSYGGTGMA